MISKTKAKSEKCGEYGEPCLALKNRTCFKGTPCRLCYIGMGYEQGKKDEVTKLLNESDEKVPCYSCCKHIKDWLKDEKKRLSKDGN